MAKALAKSGGQGSTDRRLLAAVSDWNDQPAWARFQAQYDPKIRAWCRRAGLDEDSVDEVCQLIWVELAGRMKTFRYDPNGTFRAWLRTLCVWRAHDFKRLKQTAGLVNLQDHENASVQASAIDRLDDETEAEAVDPMRLVLLSQAELVQSQVRQRVKPQSWQAFWMVAVNDASVEETADTLQMTRTAVYAAQARIARMLCEEGKRLLDRKMLDR